jgi:hypothetical protein
MERDINTLTIFQITSLKRNTFLRTSKEKSTIIRQTKDLRERSKRGSNIGEKPKAKKMNRTKQVKKARNSVIRCQDKPGESKKDRI